MVISLGMEDLTGILRQLGSILPVERLLTAEIDLVPYAFDGTAALSQRPLAVILATTTEEVSAVLRWANETRTPVVARGSGTGLAGGSVPTAGSVVLCLTPVSYTHLDVYKRQWRRI